MEISGPDTKAESILELGHTILGEIGSTAAAAGISSPGLRIRVRLSSEQFEAEEEGGRMMAQAQVQGPCVLSACHMATVPASYWTAEATDGL